MCLVIIMSEFKGCLAVLAGAVCAAAVGYATNIRFKNDVDLVLEQLTSGPAIRIDPSKDFKKVTIPGEYAAPGEAKVWYVGRGEPERKLECILSRDGDGTFAGKAWVYNHVDVDGDRYITLSEVDKVLNPLK